MADNVQFNVRIPAELAPLAREVVDRLKNGGPAFRQALREFLADEAAHKYMSRSEIDARFRDVEDDVRMLKARVAELAAAGAAPPKGRKRGE